MVCMSKDVPKSGMETEEAKKLDLDQQPKPIRKADNAAFPELDQTEQTKRKGKRKVK